MPADNPPEVQIVWADKRADGNGIGRDRTIRGRLDASPALLVIKPHLGLIVSLEDIKHDRRYFALAIAVEEAIVAPEGFDAQVPITLKCVWNQPYMSLSVDSISAPYCFLPSFRSSRRATDSRIQRHEVV